MGVRSRVSALPLSSFNSANIVAGYLSLNGTGLEEACSFIRIVNDSDEDVTISYDGVTDHEIVFNGETLILSFQANSSPTSYSALLSKGTKIYGKGTAGIGTIYISGYFTNPIP